MILPTEKNKIIPKKFQEKYPRKIGFKYESKNKQIRIKVK